MLDNSEYLLIKELLNRNREQLILALDKIDLLFEENKSQIFLGKSYKVKNKVLAARRVLYQIARSQRTIYLFIRKSITCYLEILSFNEVKFDDIYKRLQEAENSMWIRLNKPKPKHFQKEEK